MEAKAHLRYIRISPRKVKIVLDLIRGKDTAAAMGILKNTPKSASEYLVKLLKSACANAENNFGLDPRTLVISEAFANEGPTMRRFQPRAQGRAFQIRKRSSHITVVVESQKEGAK